MVWLHVAADVGVFVAGAASTWLYSVWRGRCEDRDAAELTALLEKIRRDRR